MTANHKKSINMVCVTKCKVLNIIAHVTLVTTALRRLRIILRKYLISHATRQIKNQNPTLHNCSRHKNISNLLR